ncbi:uncharacterized protein PHACADRAFT_262853 [Phanerochaete carnosa HHB-10118-sp]|uniref:Uncharacterized protein n=1 Tax=Phanerochaete carnosa (strain HHB-10118-sp) TaxID=650164 RepID=K5VVW2_PHACS|nr:uncharacterized protein PHACADRAFT_177655 [Phanerochaete carnosa HHB-10118-sp]XP_007400116.1 uncharacterized protein PHACADRAFT_262853 [Phanerochaete carnosa HHB-10118-sp]EKM50949.1 hypothetical protein PHACADRAFT_177655 [Phanerochaete carnosa HHB-10118-sp]EKM50950.1 hypothetical protein PHACADRAFT_262853 [Phanerochaete carnosa HHB-10118-sp]
MVDAVREQGGPWRHTRCHAGDSRRRVYQNWGAAGGASKDHDSRNIGGMMEGKRHDGHH